jgi:hypothetical protein
MGPLPSTFVQMIEVNFTGVAYSLFLAHFWFEVVLRHLNLGTNFFFF